MIYHLLGAQIEFSILVAICLRILFSALITIWIFPCYSQILNSLFSLSLFFRCLLRSLVTKYRSLKSSKSGHDITSYYRHYFYTVMWYHLGNLVIFQIIALATFYFLDRSISLLLLFLLLLLQLSRHNSIGKVCHTG